MNHIDQLTNGPVANETLPTWWRFLLMAVATIILCSCSRPAKAQEITTDELTPAPIESGETSIVISDGATFLDSAMPMPPDSLEGPVFDAPGEAFICDDEGLALDGAATSACMLCDPQGRLIGPSDEYLCDGGDFHTPAGVRADWVVQGLEQEDAIAHYDTVDGRVVVVPSNRVCIYAPRFAAVRRVVNLVAHEQPQYVNVMLEEQSPAKAAESQPVVSSLQRHAPIISRSKRPPILFRQRQQAGELEQLYATMDAYNSQSAYAALEIIRAGIVVNAEKPRILVASEHAITWTGNQAPQVVIDNKRAQLMDGLKQVGIIYQADEPNNPRLRLVKLASCGHALPGEEVEFTLRFDNIGDQEIGNVTIVDNLSTRLEYIPGTSKGSVDAVFSTIPNEGGSTILRWEITDAVGPGKGGVLRFRTRVR